MKERIQKFGRFLSGMVMPNIGAFIAWGFIAALFIADGWFPNEAIATMVSPMLNYLLPLLIGYTGGKMVGGQRGAVAGAIATLGVIVGADITMFIGAMIAGPLGGLLIKWFDKAMENHIPAGFEMLINNFSVGILGGRPVHRVHVPDRPRLHLPDQRPGRRCGGPGGPRPAAPDRHPGGARQGPVPEQRHQPRCVHPHRHGAGHGGGKSILFMIESNPRPRPGPAAGLLRGR